MSLALLLGGCGADIDGANPVPDPAEAGRGAIENALHSSIALAEVPAPSVELARALLEESTGSDATPRWTGAAALEDEVFVYEHPDVEGAAYFEFGVDEGGRIMVATGRHDSPIPAFSDRGEPLARALREQAEASGREAVRLYRIAGLDTLATDASGEIVAHGSAFRRAVGRSLDEYVMALEEARAELDTYKSASSRYDAQWDAIYPTQNKAKDSVLYRARPSLALKDIKWLYHSDLLRTQIRWEQHDLDPSAKATCWAGCGPVAFAQVAAYLAYSERWGNPKYQGSGSVNLYPNTSTRLDAPDARQLISDLHYEFDSFCWSNVRLGESPIFSESAAAPWNLDRFKTWALGRGANVRLETSWGGPSGGDETAAWNAIRRGNPVVLGWNFEHYNVGVGAGLLNSTKYVWVNNGQGNGSFDGWMPYDQDFMFFSGIVQSWVAGK